ncbi:glycogen synthase kinase-3 beta-like protein [Dermatophagoides farinae]|uniref:Glycogen synthase kinase-3 beta-like protein n=1 Tax=Dermatophagoides farinae TaxID=6954 RepID=A0A9D4SER8_DERFA|nr:glycogen synthase kinase-3 beta-like protein [Dermatophagoides farinae]
MQQIILNAHNHPTEKQGRTIAMNTGNMSSSKMSERKFTVYENNHRHDKDSDPIELSIALEQVFDKGAFGHVRTAFIKGEKVAIKHVLQDKRYRNRELPLMKQLNHRNIVTLLYYFYHTEYDHLKNSNIFLNLVMEYIPTNLNMLIQKSNRNRKNSRHSLPHGDLCSLSPVPATNLFTIKLCMYQIFRGLAYIHSQGICHRDIKPNNLLFNSETGVLKICDFGSAKHLRRGDSHVSYICARFYRAPELLFGATDYNEKIDLWSTGVVFSELLLGQPIFYEQSGLDQLVCIISKLGTPTKEQILAMNPKYARYQFPQVYPRSWPLLFPCAPTDALDLISKLFAYDPSHRIAPLHACAHQFFDELRDPNKKWSSNRDLPPLFDFSQHELSIDSRINSRLPSYKTKPNANIAYLQQTTQQLATRMFPSSLPASSAIHLGPYPMATHFSRSLNVIDDSLLMD